MLAIFVSVRLYRAFHNPFFKFQGIALFLGLAVAGLRELRPILVGRFIDHFEKLFYQTIGASIGTISAIIGLVGILLAVYTLLQYREGWEQAEEVSLIKMIPQIVVVDTTAGGYVSLDQSREDSGLPAKKTQLKALRNQGFTDMQRFLRGLKGLYWEICFLDIGFQSLIK